MPPLGERSGLPGSELAIYYPQPEVFFSVTSLFPVAISIRGTKGTEWGDGSVGKGLAVQTFEPKSDAQNPCAKDQS